MQRLSLITLCLMLTLAAAGCSQDKGADDNGSVAPSAPSAPKQSVAPGSETSVSAGPKERPAAPEVAGPPKSGETTKGKLVTTASGLQYEDLVVGKGAAPTTGQSVVVDYTGTLADGTKFDSNVDPAFNHVQPFTFTLGASMVIKGWDEGVATMKVGGKRKLVIPPALAYGDNPPPGAPIPPGATLTFVVELKGIQ